jgi:hypothetical protein
MPTTQAQLVYEVQPLGAANVDIAAALAAVPIPFDVLFPLGVRFISDTVTAATPVTRTITLGLTPISAAVVTAQTWPGSPTGSPISGLTLVTKGRGYAAPPVIQIVDTGPVKKPKGWHPGSGARAVATLDVHDVNVDNGGTLYVAPPPVSFVGGLAPGGVAATGHSVLLVGVVSAIVVDTHGGPYEAPPQVVIGPPPPGGTQAQGTAILEVSGVQLVGSTKNGAGEGYVNPIVNVIPLFKRCFPDVSGLAAQGAPFNNLMTSRIVRALCCPIFAAPTLVL